MKILVTGSSGTIGTALCERLMKDGHEIVCVDWRENIWNKEINSKTIDVDLRDKEKVFTHLPKDIDMIIHFAANARVFNLIVDPTLAMDNIKTTFNMLEFARKNNIKKFLFSSSREVYGNMLKITRSEDEVCLENCESPYTASKITGEALIYAYQKCYDLDYIVVRFSNVYGKYDNSDRVVPLFIRQCKKGEDLKVFGRDKFLDFTYISDAIDAIILCIEKFEDGKNNTYNIASEESASIVRVAEFIKNKLQSDNEIIIEGNRTGEVVKYVADITKIKSKLGYKPKVGVDAGIMKSIDWYGKNTNGNI